MVLPARTFGTKVLLLPKEEVPKEVPPELPFAMPTMLAPASHPQRERDTHISGAFVPSG